MSRIRFETADDVFEAFPPLAADMEARPAGERPEAFARALVEGETPFEALTFLACVLPRREAIHWYCRALRRLPEARLAAPDAALALAERWVQDPAESLRLEALSRVSVLDLSAPSSWASVATAWSGGALYTGDPARRPEGLRPASPYLVAQAVRAGLLLLFARLAPADQREAIRALVADALAIANGEPG